MPHTQPEQTTARPAPGAVATAAGELLSLTGAALEIYGIVVPHATVAGLGAMMAGLVPGGLGIGILAGVRGYRARLRGDTRGEYADAFGAAGGVAIAAAAVVSPAGVAVALPFLAAGILGALTIGIFHAGRRLHRW